MTQSSTDKFWADDFHVLLRQDRAVEFFPTPDQTVEERLNAITRLIAYISVALAVYQGKTTSIWFGLFLIVLVYSMWRNKSPVIVDMFTGTQSSNEALPMTTVQGDCVPPTPQNPMGNYLLGDDPNRPEACKGKGYQQQASALLNDQLFQDVDDLFSRNANQRMFVTNPSTTRLPDRDGFVNWLVKGTEEDFSKTPTPFVDLTRNKPILAENLNEDVYGRRVDLYDRY